MFGLFAFPAMGIYRSMKTIGLSPMQKEVLEAKHMLSSYVNSQIPLEENEARMALDLFEKKGDLMMRESHRH